MTATTPAARPGRPRRRRADAASATPVGRAREYLELALDLRPIDPASDTFEVAILPSSVGETAAVRVPYRRADLEPGLRAVEGGQPKAAELIDFGEALADRLLPPGEVRELVTHALKKVGLDGGVRLRLVVHDPALAQLPWEFAYFQRHRGERDTRHFLVLDPRLSLIRHEPLPEDQPVLLAATPDRLRIVAATANVSAYPPLDLERERRVIETALAGFDVDGTTLEMTFLEGATRASVFDALRGGAHIFHFAGHGEFRARGADDAGRPRSTGALVVASKLGSANGETLDAGEVAVRLRQAGVRLAMLGACDSGRRDGVSAWTSIAPAVLEAGVAAAVAMQYAVGDEYAIAFSSAFYRAVAAGLSVDEAVSLGRLAMLGVRRGTAQWGIPVLYTRAPDGRLFPRPADRPSTTADRLRTAVRQTVETIEAGGVLVGIRGPIGGGGTGGRIEVIQDVGTLHGEAVGIDGSGSGDGPIPDTDGEAAGPAARRRRRRTGPAARVEQRVGENLGSLSAFRQSVIHGDVQVALEIGAQIYLFTDRSRGSVADGVFDREVSPFPGVRPFSFETRTFFCGRSALVGEVERAVASRPVVVVQGPSGSGKSSLLMAGLAPRAIERGLLVVRLEDYVDPAGTLRAALASQAERLSIDLGSDETFPGLLRAVTRGGGGTLVLLLDQFERLFLLSPEAQAALVAGLVTALADAGPLLRVVLSVREDQLGRLADVGSPLPGLLDRPVRVNRLSRAEAAAAIREPLLRHDTVGFDEAFVERLLDDLDELSGPPPDEIEPGQLQIVCASLFERGRALRDEGRSPVITAALYGEGAESISLEYLGERLQAGLGPDREVGEAVLQSMLASRSAGWLSPAELELEGAPPPPPGVEDVLRRLVKLGLLVERRVEAVEYSLATPAVEALLERLGGPQLVERRRAHDVLEAIGLEWRVRRAVARRGQLRLLAAATQPLAMDWAETAVLLRSAVVLREPVEPWRAALAAHVAETSSLELDAARGALEPSTAAIFGGPASATSVAQAASGPGSGSDEDRFGPLARLAATATEAVDRGTAVLALSTVPDFEVRLDRALQLLPRGERRDREIELWATLTDAGVEAAHVMDRFGRIDRLRIAVERGRRRLHHHRRRLVGMSAGAGFGMGLGLGLVRFGEALIVRAPPLGELSFWLMWGGLLGAVVTAAVLGTRLVRTGPATTDGRPQGFDLVPIAAGAVAFGLALWFVALGNGLNLSIHPLVGPMGFLAGAAVAGAVAAVTTGARLAPRRAFLAAIGVGIILAAIQATLLVVHGRSAALPFLHSRSFFSGGFTQGFPGLATADPALFDLLPTLEGFVVGVVIVLGIAVGRVRGRAVVERWERVEAMAGD